MLEDITVARTITPDELGESRTIHAMPWNANWIREEHRPPSVSHPFLVHIVDPFSWAAIAELIIGAIAKQFLQEIARQILDVLSGKNLRDIIHTFFSALVDSLRTVVNEQSVKIIGGDAAGLERSLRAFAESPESRTAIFPQLLVNADKYYSEAEDTGPAGLAVTTILASLRFGINVMQAKDSNTDGDWRTCKRVIDDFEIYLGDPDHPDSSGMEFEIAQLVNRRFGGVAIIPPRYVSVGKEELTRKIPGWSSYEFDGSTVFQDENYEPVAAARARHLEGVMADTMTKTILPARSLVSEMRKKLNEIHAFAASED
jgi:hypothetical protein